jgi:hypothetical protein
MTTTIRKPTRMEQIKGPNDQIDRLVALRDASRTKGERKAYEYEIGRVIRDRDFVAAGLFVTACWLACIVGMFATSGPLAFVWMVGVVVNGFCLVDLWADAYRAWTGEEEAELGL